MASPVFLAPAQTAGVRVFARVWRCSLPVTVAGGSTWQPRVPARQRRGPAPLAAAVAPVALGSISWSERGVWLVSYLAKLPLPQAVAMSALLLGVAALATAAAQRALELGEKKLSDMVERTRPADGLELFVEAGLEAARRPAGVILPLFLVDLSLLVLAALTEVALTHLNPQLHSSFLACGSWAVFVLKSLTCLLQESTDILVIVFMAWYLRSWKNMVIEAIQARVSSGGGMADSNQLTRMLVPIKTLTTLVIGAAAIVTCLGAVGLDIRPLLAFGGAGSLAVGLASQSAISNLVSALSIYASSPFIKGDRIQLKSLSGSLIVAGVVESIRPMRTMIRTDAKVPFYIQNKDVINLAIVNESQVKKSAVVANPLIDMDLTLRHQDTELLEAIEAAIMAHVNAMEEVEEGTCKCALSNFTDRGPVLRIKAVINESHAGKAMFVKGKILRAAQKEIAAQGASLYKCPDFILGF